LVLNLERSGNREQCFPFKKKMYKQKVRKKLIGLRRQKTIINGVEEVTIRWAGEW